MKLKMSSVHVCFLFRFLYFNALIVVFKFFFDVFVDFFQLLRIAVVSKIIFSCKTCRYFVIIVIARAYKKREGVQVTIYSTRW